MATEALKTNYVKHSPIDVGQTYNKAALIKDYV